MIFTSRKMLCSPYFRVLNVIQYSINISRTSKTATDPIQNLFLEKIREYKNKSTGGKLVEPTPEIEKELKTEISKIEKHYGVDVAVNMNIFPQFKFEEPKLDPIDEPVAKESKKSKKGPATPDSKKPDPKAPPKK